ncbi:citrate synthase/methylcitrate synthase [Desmospora activa]|uniref:Citrate synthase n=1 Tax=Desmospora activa DSM 45169 TaxID=1121389 RepID=A0A2T4ZDE9_9BACL|nr:citrate synthase/methylcitrate synthase [Desmospora activa]PTM59910.1 citrate synthase [Desmospora activa DSM 45169]
MGAAIGMEGVYVADTALSLVDGQKGALIYRGHGAKDLALSHSFEEVAHLLLLGQLPEGNKAEIWRSALASKRALTAEEHRLLDALPPNMDMMESLRTGVSALSWDGAMWPPTPEAVATVLARIPTLVAYRWHRLQGTPFIQPRADLSHTANYLYLLTGKEPNPAHVRALDAYLVLTAEHGLNASTFAARVVTSTQSDGLSALTAAIGALKGPLHGGAPAEVEEMLEQIGSSSRAADWLQQRLQNGERLMGFGHRVYRTRDPRAEALREVAQQLASEEPWFELALEVEAEALRLLQQWKPERKLYTNVEFYAAVVLRAVGLPRELYTPTFTVARMAGWCAHILEQAANNRIIRPQSRYVGPLPEKSS